MYYVYVLRSLKNNKRYVGFTNKDPKERLVEHNSGTNTYTKQNRPYKLIYFEKFTEENLARKREKFFKTGQGRRFIDKLIPP